MNKCGLGFDFTSFFAMPSVRSVKDLLENNDSKQENLGLTE